MVTRAWIEARLNETESSNSHAPGSLFYGTTREPLIVRPEDGGFEAMGGKLPDKSFTVQDVARLVGPDRQVDVIGMPLSSHSPNTMVADQRRRSHTVISSMESQAMGRIRPYRRRPNWQFVKSLQYHFARSDGNRAGEASQSTEIS